MMNNNNSITSNISYFSKNSAPGSTPPYHHNQNINVAAGLSNYGFGQNRHSSFRDY